MIEFIFIFFIFLCFLIIMSLFFSNIITVRRKTLKINKDIAEKRIIYLADPFSNRHRIRTKAVFEKVKKLRPDIVIISGYGFEKCTDDIKKLIEELSLSASVFFAFSDFPNADKSLDNGQMKIFKDHSVISVSDKASSSDELIKFSRLDNLKIAVFRHPSQFDKMTDFKNADIAFSWYGGGLMLRIPFFGIIFTSKEGIAPMYPARFYLNKGSVFAVTTGVGESFLPFRLNNFREIICIDIKK